MKSFRLRIGAVAILLAGAVGCGGTIPIKKLLDDPAHYDQKTVKVAGTVDHAVGVLGYGAYRLNDGTGTLNVVTKEGGTPREGAKVGVEGEFHAAFTVGTVTAAALVEKSHSE